MGQFKLVFLLVLPAVLLIACGPADQGSIVSGKHSAAREAKSSAESEIERLEKSANSGERAAQLDLARRYERGAGVVKNEERAFTWYLKAAEAKHVDAMVEVARRFSKGLGTRKDFEKSKYWWTSAAESGNAEAQMRVAAYLAWTSRKGTVVWGERTNLEANAEQFINWISKAAAQGYPEAQYKLAMTLILGGRETISSESKLLIQPDKEKGLELLRKAADAKYWEAEIAMASLYQLGFGSVKPDQAVSQNYWNQVQEHADPETQRHIGSFYREYSRVSYVHGANKYRGRMLSFDESNVVAYEWFQKGAAQGDSVALYNLAQMNRDGVGTYRSEQKALDLFKQAAELGHSQAAGELAFAYLEGKGVVRDYVEARKWLITAANADESGPWSDVPKLRNALGVLYEFGHGVEKDAVLAYAWYNLAAAGGYDKAKQNLARVERALSPESLGEAQRLSREWRPGLDIDTRAVSGTSTTQSRSGSRNSGLKLASVGSGFLVSQDGHILTNNHVVERCTEIRIPVHSETATRVVSDKTNDLAVLRANLPNKSALIFQDAEGVKQGEGISVFGFPLDGYLPAAGNFTVGIVSALAGPGNNASLVQITAPVQPGNSGGPMLNRHGHIVGVIVGKADAIRIASATGDIPQNINFAISLATIRSFLTGNRIPFQSKSDRFARSRDQVELAEIARTSTVKIECWR